MKLGKLGRWSFLLVYPVSMSVIIQYLLQTSRNDTQIGSLPPEGDLSFSKSLTSKILHANILYQIGVSQNECHGISKFLL